MSTQAQPESHPVRLVVTDDLQRNRLTVFFRLILAIPHFVVLMVWSIVAWLIAIVSWVITIFTGRMPDALHNAQAAFLVYQTRVSAYLYLLADPFPPFGTSDTYPVDLEVDPPADQSRLTVFFRLILAIPALILASILQQLLQILAFIGWFVALFTGKMPQGMRDLGAFCLRYYQQMTAYVFLVTGRYPSLSGGPTA